MSRKDLKIDFVITWVDGSDSAWKKERAKYSANADNDDGENRYRDFGLLKYWFRAVEEYAPWVNKIHFVTCGQVPEWLDIDNPKLNIVKHSDYMPDEILPTFNSVPIELYLHNILGLSENFVYFNDDMFLNAPVKPSFFFKHGFPRDAAILSATTPTGNDDHFGHCLFANAEMMDKKYNIHSVIRHNFGKWFNYRYGSEQIRTLLLLPWSHFPGIKMHHIPISYKKSSFEKIWRENRQELSDAASDRFRNNYKINHFVIRYDQLLSGKFSPRSPRFGKPYMLEDEESLAAVQKDIVSGKHKMICINDGVAESFFNKSKDALNIVFDKKFCKKSSFER